MPEKQPTLLTGLKLVEISAFVAAPLGAIALAQLGADVIRIDPFGGNINANRWPISEDWTSICGTSLADAVPAPEFGGNTHSLLTDALRST